MCGGTFIGPVGTTREASNMVQSGFPVPPLHVRCAPLLVENAPELLALKESTPSCPVMLRISSRPQAPAWPIPSTQFRKRARLFENSIGLNGFFAGLRPFRNWTLGADGTAGAWGSDAMRNIVGKIGAIPHGGVSVAGVSDAFYEGGTAVGWQGGPYDFKAVYMDISRVVSTGPQNTPQHVWQPVIIYLGRPR